MKKKLLIIASHLPSLKVPQGGHKSAFSILKSFSTVFDIYLFTFINEKEIGYYSEKDYEFCSRIEFVKINNISRLIAIIRNFRLPFKVATRVNNNAKKMIIELQKEIKFDQIHFEFTSSAYYYKYINSGTKTSISEHDLTYQLIERKFKKSKFIKKLFYKFEFSRQKRWEMKLLNKIDHVLVHNIKDRTLLLEEGIVSEKITTVSPYVDPIFKSVNRGNFLSRSILFWGAMNRSENIDGIKWFVSSIFPIVINRYSDAQLFIVGAHPTEKVKRLRSKNIHVTGFVKDPIEYFEKCQLAVAPLRVGAGIKIKVLEYLSASIPVVSTTIGAESIEGENLFIADDAFSFADKICEIFALEKSS